MPGDAEKIRQMFLQSLTDQSLGLSVHKRQAQIHFTYPIANFLGHTTETQRVVT